MFFFVGNGSMVKNPFIGLISRDDQHLLANKILTKKIDFITIIIHIRD